MDVSFVRINTNDAKQWPSNSIIGGYEADGRPLYVARCAHEGGFHPGKAGPHLSGANFSYGGKELSTHNFEILVGTAKGFAVLHWVQPAGVGELHKLAYPVGQERDGRPLWIARTKHGGGLHLGKAAGHLSGINFPYGGAEICKHQGYEVLTSHDRLV